MSDFKYCYPDTNVLINKANIRNLEELHVWERQVSSFEATVIDIAPIKGNFDQKHLQAIHKALFSEIYDWAGKFRTVDIAKSNMFCRVQFMQEYSDDIFSRLKDDRYLIGMDKDKAIGKLAEYIGDINALHPFREGNGRTQRKFISYLAKAIGIELDFTKVGSEKMMDASMKSFLTDYSGFKEIFNEIARPMPLQEQENFIKGISREAYKEFKKQKQNALLLDREAEFDTGNAVPTYEDRRTLDKSAWEDLMRSGTSLTYNALEQQRDMELPTERE